MPNSLESISELFQAVSAPARLEILLIIGAGESCVCYLEAQLGYRQAYISQHLMAMRQAGLIESRREGKLWFQAICRQSELSLSSVNQAHREYHG